jgi:hypothetical protein
VSSAILYLAIVAIWACVLIPRWLRRGAAHVSGPAIAGHATPGEDDLETGDASVHAGADRTAPDPDRSRVAVEAREEAEDADQDADAGEGSPAEDVAPPPLTPEESRQRMMAARRRLLAMMIALEAAAILLAVFGLAALWVVIPPSVMLTGYLLLLREAAHADAERRQREQEAAWARDRARTRAQARAKAVSRARAEQRAAAPAAVATRPVPASPAAQYEDAGPGRDFAPGLAGKYTTSNAEVIPISERGGEDAYDQYTQNKLRAVGD